ncbi:AEC family transporter [bacterium]|nr:AEC family transporter [bacterium]
MNLPSVLAPLLLSVLCGVLMGLWRKLRPEPFVTAVMDLFMPALVFDALLTARVSAAELFSTAIASCVVILFLFGLCLLVKTLTARPLRSFALPVLFMNAGFLGMPLMDLAFGAEAIGRIVVFDQVQSFFMFSLGIWIAMKPSEAGGAVWMESLKAFLKEPLIHSILLAVLFRALGMIPPEFVLSPIRWLGAVTPVLALFALGLRLAATPVSSFSRSEVRRSLGLILGLRFGGGILCGLLAVSMLGLEGMTRQVVLIASGLPSAVFSYILAERYGAEPDLTAAAVFTSTIVSLPLIPLLLKFTA